MAASSSLQPGAQIVFGAPEVQTDTIDPTASPPGKPTAAEMSAGGSLLFIKTLHRTSLWHRRPGEDVISMLRARPAGDCIYAASPLARLASPRSGLISGWVRRWG